MRLRESTTDGQRMLQGELSRLQALYLTGIVHRVVKPDNSLMDLGLKQNVVHEDLNLCNGYGFVQEIFDAVRTRADSLGTIFSPSRAIKHSFFHTVRFALPNGHRVVGRDFCFFTNHE
ncbi:unnamed protein product [Onchocerca ochengi]|uniref:Protein kinase domain-containing protein n=1 Tax=Onchocerca ochengi TaxID=42157 RepID=A0A182DXK2_ONCOC|nr:unnamed protein product [Onchocerca ochengi]